MSLGKSSFSKSRLPDNQKCNLPPATDERGEGRNRPRGIVFLLPSLLTLGNFLFGYLSITFTLRADYRSAAKAIALAMVMDLLDGRTARLTGAVTDFGLQLDSLADLVSFGIAPSLLVLKWGFSSLDLRLAWITAFIFATCGAIRLARFNIQGEPSKTSGGLSMPAAGGTIAAIVNFFERPVDTTRAAILLVLTVCVLASLMISVVHYPSLKNVVVKKDSWFILLAAVIGILLLYKYPRWTLLIVAGTYALSGITHALTKTLFLFADRQPETRGQDN